MSGPSAETIRFVRDRAGDRCEYCRMHQALQGATFHVEHIRPRSRGGTSDLHNLAWSCPGCNLRKSDRIDAPDPENAAFVPLFHPRNGLWAEHFRWDGPFLYGRTPCGRATVETLGAQPSQALKIREAEGMFDLFPP